MTVGRRSRAQALTVWINGIRVARWAIPTRGAMELVYDPAWVASAEGRPLSLSLPMNAEGVPLRGDRVAFFFDNLLPDSETLRQRIRERFRAGSIEAFDLLGEVGRDCVGALQLLPDGQPPEGQREIRATPMNEEEIERVLLACQAKTGLFSGQLDDDFRISLAGAQEKTALLRHGGRWCKPHGATPTTHIFKLALGLVGSHRLDMSTSVENEWLCAQLLAAYGVPVARCEVAEFGATKTLIVERFDRRLHSSGAYWLRLPLEDFCQATGAPGSKKYEADGGPGLGDLARILGASEDGPQDLATLLRAQLLFWMLAATDGHAKNFSIYLLAQGRLRLAPLYDVLSAWPVVGAGAREIHRNKLKMAMALQGTQKHYNLARIARHHFNTTARRCGLSNGMEFIIEEVLARTPGAIQSVEASLPPGFPPGLFDAVTAGLRESAERLAAMPAE